MRTPALSILTVTLLLFAACSKEELTETVTDGVSAIATPTSHQKNGGGNFHVWTEVWFNRSSGQAFVKLNGNTRPPVMEMQIVHQRDGAPGEDPNGNSDQIVTDLELSRQGNSKVYHSGQDQFVFGTDAYFSLVDVKLTAKTFIDDWQGETAYLQMFLYPSGRTVEQDPKIFLRRVHVKETLSGKYDEAIAELTIVVADDPAQEVAQVKFVPNPIYRYPDDPSFVVYPEPSYLEKTHENTNLGLSRWSGPGRGGAGSSGSFGGEIYLITPDSKVLDTKVVK